MKLSAKRIATGLYIGSVFALAGCGGGGSSTTSPVAATGTATGILTDAPIDGISYSTSSGVTGTTVNGGVYKYNPGDTVTFKIGSVTLGNPVTATGIVTPANLSAGSGANATNVFNNMLVLLQSLNTSGNVNTSIVIPPTAAAALTGVDLTTASNTAFASSISPAIAAAGSGALLVSTSQAQTNFMNQGLSMLSGHVWLAMKGNNVLTSLLRFAPNGTATSNGYYLHGQATLPGGGGNPGVQLGSITVTAADSAGFTIVAGTLSAAPTAPFSPSASYSVNTEGQWGLGDPSFTQKLSSAGDNLITTGCISSNCTIVKAPNNPAGIVGVWARGSSSALYTQHFVFLADGTFMTVDPLGDSGNGVNPPGVEHGTYTFANGSLTITSVDYDTNLQAGLVNSTNSPIIGTSTPVTNDVRGAVLSSDGMSIVITNSNNVNSTLYRVSN